MPGTIRKKSKTAVILYSIIGVAIIAAITYWSGVYGKTVLSVAESVSFSAPFPAGNVTKMISLKTPAGASVVAKPVNINLGERGIFKKILNPQVEKVVLNNLTNVDTRPHRIGLSLTNEDIRVEWDVRSGLPFDTATMTFVNAIKPGASVPGLKTSMLFYFPDSVKSFDTWYEGGLKVYDADTHEDLTTIPIKFVAGGN
jgi:hypothetical protein